PQSRLHAIAPLMLQHAALRPALAARHRVGHILERQPRESAAPQPIDTVVRADRQQPRREAPLAVEAGQARIGPQEDLLAGVLGVLRVAKHAIGQIIDGAGVAVHKLAERPLVAAERLLDPADLLGLLLHAPSPSCSIYGRYS